MTKIEVGDEFSKLGRRQIHSMLHLCEMRGDSSTESKLVIVQSRNYDYPTSPAKREGVRKASNSTIAAPPGAPSFHPPPLSLKSSNARNQKLHRLDITLIIAESRAVLDLHRLGPAIRIRKDIHVAVRGHGHRPVDGEGREDQREGLAVSSYLDGWPDAGPETYGIIVLPDVWRVVRVDISFVVGGGVWGVRFARGIRGED